MKKSGILLLMFISLLISATVFSQVIKGTYAIKNVETGILLRIKDANKTDGTPIVAYSPENWKCVTWNFNHVEGQAYILKNLLSGKTIQSVNQTPLEGDALNEQPVGDTALQQYEFIPVGKKIFFIKLKGTDLYLTPSDNKGNINAPVILSKKSGAKLQQWAIYEQHPEI